MKILLCSSDTARAEPIENNLSQAGYRLVVCVEFGGEPDLLAAVTQHAPDVLIISVETPDDAILEDVRRLNREMPKPIVFFTDRSDYETTQAMINADVSTYIVNAGPDNRIKTLIDVAMTRFQASHHLRSELETYKQRLDDRKAMDKAKGLLMQHRQLTEDAAYQALRTMAMDNNMRIGEAARHFIAAMSLLN